MSRVFNSSSDFFCMCASNYGNECKFGVHLTIRVCTTEAEAKS